MQSHARKPCCAVVVLGLAALAHAAADAKASLNPDATVTCGECTAIQEGIFQSINANLTHLEKKAYAGVSSIAGTNDDHA